MSHGNAHLRVMRVLGGCLRLCERLACRLNAHSSTSARKLAGTRYALAAVTQQQRTQCSHSMMAVEWVAVPRPATHRTLISLGAVGGVIWLGSGRCLDSCSAAFCSCRVVWALCLHALPLTASVVSFFLSCERGDRQGFGGGHHHPPPAPPPHTPPTPIRPPKNPRREDLLDDLASPKEPVCVASGKIISEDQPHTRCRVCKHPHLNAEAAGLSACPLCHAPLRR